jgi:uncharacterized BrkB/YihY/UPF0761 family membrane protein
MGFKHWFQGMEVICMFAVVIGVPCFFTGFWGSKMINELGNHPSKSFQIQAAATWKILLVEIISFVLLMGLYAFLINIQNE